MPAPRVTRFSPFHIILVLEDSSTMQGLRAYELNSAVIAMIDELKLLSSGVNTSFKISIITFGSGAEVVCEAMSEQAIDVSKGAVVKGSSDSANAVIALEATYRLIQRNPGTPNDFNPYIFFLLDGAPDDANAALTIADKLKQMSIASGTPRLVTIGFKDADDDFMRKLATNPDMYKKLQDYKHIIKILPNIGILAQTAIGAEGMDQAIMNL